MVQWLGAREVAFILASAPEMPPPPADWEAVARRRVFFSGEGADLRSYIRAVSYGKARLLGDVYGPFAVTAQRPDGSWDLGNAMDQAIAAAQATGQVAGVTYFCVIFTDHPGPSWAFWSAGSGRCYVDNPDVLGAYAMENLHMLTQFPDLYGLADSPGGYDVMDCACGTHPSAFTKLDLGWLDPSHVVVIAPGSPTRNQPVHALSSPLAAAPTPGRAHAIKATTDVAQRYFLIEARLPTDVYEQVTPGVSSGLPAAGLVVYWIDQTAWPPVHLRKVLSKVGDSFTDQGRGLVVTLAEEIGLGLVARVDRSEPAECAQIRERLREIEQEIADLQAELQQAPPGEKAQIVAQIRRLQAQALVLRERAQKLGCRS